MKTTIKRLTAAFTLSASITTSALAEDKAIEPIGPEDCTKLLAQGEASWYGNEVSTGRDEHGNLLFNDTKSGEPYNPNLLTAAFRQKEYFGKYFKVVDAQDNHVIVRVNDLGPFSKDKHGNDRVIDLAEAAGKRLNMDGVAQVRVYLCT